MKISLIPIDGLPAIQQGDDLAAMIAGAGLQDGDIVVLAQKIVSKSEGRVVALNSVMPSEAAIELARVTEKDPRLVQLVLDETAHVLRAKPGLLIVEHRLGFVMANAGIDASNVGRSGSVILLPLDPDGSAETLAGSFAKQTGRTVAVIITDSWGRPWRLGTAGFAIGLYGLSAVRDMRGAPDMDGRPLETTSIGTGDELAAAASLLMGQANERIPAVIIRGFDQNGETGNAADLIRPAEGDMFR